jgi:spore coat protein H
MKKIKFRFIIALILPLMILFGVFALGYYQTQLIAADIYYIPDIDETVSYQPEAELPADTVSEDKGVYISDGYGDDDSIITMYLTARRGNISENSNNEFDELAKHSKLEYIKEGTDPHRTECIIQEGDENGPKEGYYGYGLTSPNATVSIRGNTSSTSVLKSYKITLHDEAEPWRSQTVINLNKHVYDILGFRQKLVTDLVKDIPGMMSLRTQFVHLYVKDETKGAANPEFVDYGIFTQLEQPNVSYLRNHGLDENGELYKAEYFEFTNDTGNLRLVSDPLFNETAFSDLIENKGKNDDYTDLINMCNDLNNPIIPIEETFERYFDEENFMKYLATQILLGDIDTTNRNYLLYSPPNSEKYYFIIYDCDTSLYLDETLVRNSFDIGSFSIEEYYSYQRGITNYFGVILFRRLFENKEYVEKLTETLEMIRSEYITNEKVYNLSQSYAAVLKNYRLSKPDTAVFSSRYQSYYDAILNRLVPLLEETTENYYDTISGLTPFFIGLPEKTTTGYHIAWDVSYNFADLPVFYNIVISNDLLGSDVIFSRSDISRNSVDFQADFAPGVYFIYMTAYDEAGHFTESTEYLSYDNGRAKYGSMSFTVSPNGTIEYTPEDYDFDAAPDPGTENTAVTE